MGLIERIPGTHARLNFRHGSSQNFHEGSHNQNAQTTLPELLSPDDTRHFNLFGSIDEGKVNGLIEQIESARFKDPQKKLFLKIKSDGGNVMQAYALLSTIETNRVGTIAQTAQSAGALLVVAGEIGRRYIVAGTPIMLHDIRHDDGVKGKLTDMEESVDALVNVRKSMMGFYKDRTKLTERQIEAIFNSKNDTYFSDQQAVKYGLVDHILGESRVFNLSSERSNFDEIQDAYNQSHPRQSRIFNIKR